MGVIARRRPLTGISARYATAVLWRGLDAAGHSAGDGADGRGRSGRDVVPISARSVNGDRTLTLFYKGRYRGKHPSPAGELKRSVRNVSPVRAEY